jgi:hypothetical protein
MVTARLIGGGIIVSNQNSACVKFQVPQCIGFSRHNDRHKSAKLWLVKTMRPRINENMATVRRAFERERLKARRHGMNGFAAWRKVLLKLRNFVFFQIPLGYQDQSGFHYGKPPAYSLLAKAWR